MTTIKNLKNEQQGATSIFVIILMVVLFVFGLAALTTALAGLKLSQKNTAWNNEYYTLEAQAEKKLAQIDQLLQKAEEVGLQTCIENGDISSFTEEYVAIAMNYLNEHSKELSLEISHDPFVLDQITVSFDVTEVLRKVPKNITVNLYVRTPNYSLEEDENGNLFPIRSDEPLKRFEITCYQEWQSQFEYEEQFDFSDPNFEENDESESPFVD